MNDKDKVLELCLADLLHQVHFILVELLFMSPDRALFAVLVANCI